MKGSEGILEYLQRYYELVQRLRRYCQDEEIFEKVAREIWEGIQREKEAEVLIELKERYG